MLGCEIPGTITELYYNGRGLWVRLTTSEPRFRVMSNSFLVRPLSNLLSRSGAHFLFSVPTCAFFPLPGAHSLFAPGVCFLSEFWRPVQPPGVRFLSAFWLPVNPLGILPFSFMSPASCSTSWFSHAVLSSASPCDRIISKY